LRNNDFIQDFYWILDYVSRTHVPNSYPVSFADSVLCVDVSVEVGEGEETVVIEEVVDDVDELVGVAVLRESSVLQLIDDFGQLRAPVVELHGVVAAGLQDLDLVDGHAEDEDVVQAHLLGHLHVSTIKGTNCQTSVQLENK